MRYSIAALAVMMASSAAALPWDLDWSNIEDLINGARDKVEQAENSTAPVDVGYENQETILPEDLDLIKYYAEFAAAAYCEIELEPSVGWDNDTNSSYPAIPLENLVACKDKICPGVQAKGVSKVYEFADGDLDTTGFIGVDYIESQVIVAYRGSKSLENWVANLMVDQTDVEKIWPECKGCKVHQGFSRAFFEEIEVMNKVVDILNLHPDFQVTAVGHSLGGALAVMATAYLRSMGYPVKLITYGQPRVGNKEFSEWISKSGFNWRVTHTDDPVPRLPPTAMDYHHIYPEFHIFMDAPLEVAINPEDVHIFRSEAESGAGGLNGLSLTNLNFDDHRAYLLPVGISSCAPREPLDNIWSKIWRGITRKF